MAFKFPDPSVTPEFKAENGITYIWDTVNTRWSVKPTEIVSMPLSSVSGDISREDLDGLYLRLDASNDPLQSRDAGGIHYIGSTAGPNNIVTRQDLDDAVNNTLDGALNDALGTSLNDAVNAAVNDALDAAVSDAVNVALDAAVDAAVTNALADYTPPQPPTPEPMEPGNHITASDMQLVFEGLRHAVASSTSFTDMREKLALKISELEYSEEFQPEESEESTSSEY